jgi:hypothetical protein
MLVLDAFRKNPSTTLMDIFLDQSSNGLNNWVDHPEYLLTKLPKSLLFTAKDVAVEIAQDIAIAMKWLGDGVEHPLQAGNDMKEYWNEIKTGMRSLRTMWRESPRKAMANFCGGFLFYISTHSVEFGVQLGLLLASGGFIFHQIGEGAEMSFKALGLIEEGTETGLKTVLVGSLWFLHCIDDPLAMLPAFLEPMNEATAVIDKAKKSMNGTDDGTDKLTTLTTLSTPEQEQQLRQMVFGNLKSYDKMNGPERVEAFKNFKAFVCAHSNGTLVIPPEAIPEAKLTVNSVANFKC